MKKKYNDLAIPKLRQLEDVLNDIRKYAPGNNSVVQGYKIVFRTNISCLDISWGSLKMRKLNK